MWAILISRPGYLEDNSWSCRAKYWSPSRELTLSSLSYTMSAWSTCIFDRNGVSMRSVSEICGVDGGWDNPKNIEDLLLPRDLIGIGVSKLSSPIGDWGLDLLIALIASFNSLMSARLLAWVSLLDIRNWVNIFLSSKIVGSSFETSIVFFGSSFLGSSVFGGWIWPFVPSDMVEERERICRLVFFFECLEGFSDWDWTYLRDSNSRWARAITAFWRIRYESTEESQYFKRCLV